MTAFIEANLLFLCGLPKNNHTRDTSELRNTHPKSAESGPEVSGTQAHQRYQHK